MGHLTFKQVNEDAIIVSLSLTLLKFCSGNTRFHLQFPLAIYNGQKIK